MLSIYRKHAHASCLCVCVCVCVRVWERERFVCVCVCVCLFVFVCLFVCLWHVKEIQIYTVSLLWVRISSSLYVDVRRMFNASKIAVRWTRLFVQRVVPGYNGPIIVFRGSPLAKCTRMKAIASACPLGLHAISVQHLSTACGRNAISLTLTEQQKRCYFQHWFLPPCASPPANTQGVCTKSVLFWTHFFSSFRALLFALCMKPG